MKSFKSLVTSTLAGCSLLFSPLLANEFSTKGSYFTASIGGSQIGDIDIAVINPDLEFDAGLGLDIGYGYDFGKTRIEANWVRGQSDGTSLLGFTVETDSTIDSLIGSIYRDFRESKTWSPFIGASIGTTNADIDGFSDSGFTYGIAYGLSYKTSDTAEVFFKAQTLVVPDLTIGNWEISNGNYTNGTIGMRIRF